MTVVVPPVEAIGDASAGGTWSAQTAPTAAMVERSAGTHLRVLHDRIASATIGRIAAGL
jgi:hypothetical protein